MDRSRYPLLPLVAWNLFSQGVGWLWRLHPPAWAMPFHPHEPTFPGLLAVIAVGNLALLSRSGSRRRAMVGTAVLFVLHAALFALVPLAWAALRGYG